MSGYRLAAEATADLDRIYEHVAAATGPAAALRVKRTFDRAFQTLAAAPRIGHARHDLTERPLLFWPVWSYFVIYDPGAEPLIIMRVLHGARDLAQILD